MSLTTHYTMRLKWKEKEGWIYEKKTEFLIDGTWKTRPQYGTLNAQNTGRKHRQQTTWYRFGKDFLYRTPHFLEIKDKH